MTGAMLPSRLSRCPVRVVRSFCLLFSNPLSGSACVFICKFMKKMEFKVFYSTVIIVVFSKTSFSDFLPIQWNTSTDAGQSRNERSYEYPMFTDIAPATCDLTANFCDPGCCLDPDCDDSELKNFNCSNTLNPCSRSFSRFDCNCYSESREFWFPVLCYVFENPIYLGVFYRTIAKIENLEDFIGFTNLGSHKYLPAEKVSDKETYVFGSKVLAYMPQNGSYTPYPHALLHGNDMLSGLSLDCNVPVKYMKNQMDSCYVRLTKKKCESGVSLGIKLYLLQNEVLDTTNDIPVVLKNLETKQTADVSVTFTSSPSSYVIKTIKGNPYKHFYLSHNTSFHSYDTNLFETFWKDSVCHNIVAQADFKFITNASEIQKVEIQLDLTNVSISNEFKEVYLKKVHDVSFFDVNSVSESVGDNYIFNRGYYIGENLNGGYIRKNGSQLNWEKGQLKIFLNGGSCIRSRDITFGYNTYAECVYPIRSSNCSHVRDEIAMKLESLTRGDYLAPYGRYSNPRRSAVPILRGYNWTEWERNATSCLIPVQQDLYIQYTTRVTPKGYPVREIVGALINRTFNNPIHGDGVPVRMRVIFVDVTSSRRKPLSRFWEGIYSPEESENAWMNIFNVFDRTVTDRELEETTFWFVLPVIVVCGTAIILRDFH